ncbi:MAG: exosortase/archaeosortase family protein [Verrucomicrobia bacterium]|nr:MAG: exosortase/archaeosortase family protein [Verrucomicrobiota bacterium]
MKLDLDRLEPRWPALGALMLPALAATTWLVYNVSWFWSHVPDLQFGWLVLALCAFLVLEAIPQLPPPRRRWSFVSVTLVGVGLGILAVFQMYQAAFGTMAASIAGLAIGTMCIVTGNILYAFGPAALGTLGAAFYFLLIAFPMPSFIQGLIVSNLQNFVAAVDVELLKLLGYPAKRSGALVELAKGQVGVDEACSGFRSLQSSIMAAVFLGFLQFRQWRWRILLGVLAVALAVLGNLTRTFYLCRQGAIHGPESVKGVHDAAGWSVLVFTAAGVACAAWIITRLQKAVDLRRQVLAEGPAAREDAKP